MPRQPRAFKPLYTRIRVELCGLRRKPGAGINLYCTVAFSINEEDFNYMQICEKVCGAFGEPIPKRAELEAKVKAALRNAAEDLPKAGAIDIADLAARVKAYRDEKQIKLEMDHLGKVVARVALDDFRRYPRVVQRDLLLYLGKQDQNARRRLNGRGITWKKYVKGQPASLFRKPVKLRVLAFNQPLGSAKRSTGGKLVSTTEASS